MCDRLLLIALNQSYHAFHEVISFASAIYNSNNCNYALKIMKTTNVMQI